MSSYYRLIGKGRDARAIIKAINDEINKLKQQINEIETIDFKEVARSNNDRVILVSKGYPQLNGEVIVPDLKVFQLPLEPDGKYLTCWFMFESYGSGTLKDSSGFNNNATIVGSPSTQTGQTDLDAWQFQTEDQLVVADNININTTQGMVSGFSINFSFFPIEITYQNSKSRIIACKTDDSASSKRYGWMIWIEPTGTLYFHVRVNNNFFTVAVSSAFTSLNKWYRVGFTFDWYTNMPRIYINGVLASNDTRTTYVGGLVLPSNLNMYISGNEIANTSRMSALMADFRYWKNKVLSADELTNLLQNGYSISDIQYVARVGAWNLPASDAYPNPGGSGGSEPPPTTDPPPTPPPPPPPTYTLLYFLEPYFDVSYFM